MKHIATFFLALAAFFPITTIAQEEAAPTPPEQTVETQSVETNQPVEETVSINVNIRHKESLVWTGTVTLVKGSTTDVTDSSQTSRPVPSDSALAALTKADQISNDFTLSDLNYYSDFGSYFINCINIVAVSKNACGNWQYVVNSNYPSVGADKVSVSNNDTIYFYFGSPRRISLGTATAEVLVPVSVLAETYDYTNDTWKPFSGAQIGATQPNPNDPYSPTVLFTETSGSDGVAHFAIPNEGEYNVGLASDYYYPSLTLTITKKAESLPQNSTTLSSNNTVQETSTSVSSSGGRNDVELTTVATTSERFLSTQTIASTTDDVLIVLDVPLDDFVTRYNEMSQNHTAIRVHLAKFLQEREREQHINQTASVVQAIGTEKPLRTNSWFSRIFQLFGF